MKRPREDPELNCAEFRQRLQSDPARCDSAMLRHRRCCDACERWAQQTEQFEKQLHQALHVAPPADLESRILHRWKTNRGKGDRRSGFAGFPVRAWSLAGSLALAFSIVLWIGLQPASSYLPARGIEELVLDHVNAELEHLQQAGLLRHAEVVPVLKQLSGEIMGRLGNVSYAEICDLKHRRIAHLVVRGDQGTFTLLFLPDFHVIGQIQIRSARFSGLVLPAEFGSLAVVGDAGTAVEQLAKRVRGALIWRT